MKKRLVFSLIIALVLIVAGVTAVGAYEGYKVNVKVHVETAVAVSTDKIEFGTMFPQQDIERGFCFGVTDSFLAQAVGGYSTVNYKVYFIPKPVPDGTTVCKPVMNDDVAYYQNIWPYLQVKMNGSDTPLNPDLYVEEAGVGLRVWTGELSDLNPCGSIHLKFLAPNFPGYFVPETDPRATYEIGQNVYDWPVFPAFEGDPDIWCKVTETICDGGDCEFEALVPHADLGNELVIQVIGFTPDAAD